MAYTKEILDKLIAKHGGPDQILTMTFNNSYIQQFFSVDFDPATMYDADTDMFIFPGQDARRNKWSNYKPLEYLEGVIFKDKDKTKADYDPIVVRG